MVSLLATAAQGFAAHCAGHETRCINSRTEGLLDREVLTVPTREMLVHLRIRTLARLQLQPNSTVNYEWMMRTYRQGMHWSKQGLTPGYWPGASPAEGQEDAGGCLYGHTSLEQAVNGHECVADPVPPCGGKTACGWCGRHVSIHVCTCLSQPAARGAPSDAPQTCPVRLARGSRDPAARAPASLACATKSNAHDFAMRSGGALWRWQAVARAANNEEQR